MISLLMLIRNEIQQLIIEQESTDMAIDYNDLQLLIIRIESEGLEVALAVKIKFQCILTELINDIFAH